MFSVNTVKFLNGEDTLVYILLSSQTLIQCSRQKSELVKLGTAKNFIKFADLRNKNSEDAVIPNTFLTGNEENDAL